MKLQTNRLVLRNWCEDDIEDLLAGLNNLNVSRWLAKIPYPYSKANAEHWIQYCLEHGSKIGKQIDYYFAIELQSEHKVIGGTGLERIDYFQGTAGGGIWFNERYHGYGYGTEAFGERIRFAFEESQLRRIENGYFQGNIASLKMQKKLGYQLEGVKRKAFRCMATGQIEEWRRG